MSAPLFVRLSSTTIGGEEREIGEEKEEEKEEEDVEEEEGEEEEDTSQAYRPC